LKQDASSSPRRWYDDACGTAHALELIGERWALLVLREMMFGPRRFGDIRAALPGISANVLSQRLASLEAAGLVERSRLAPPASVQVYGLTPWGYEADQLLMVLGMWAARSPGHNPTLPLSRCSLMLSFRTMFRPERAGDAIASLGFILGDETFVVTVADGVLTAQRDSVEDAGAVLTTTPEVMAGYVYGKVPLEPLEASGAVTIAGDRDMVVAFQDFFLLPPRADGSQP